MNINHNHDLLIVTCSLRRSITIHIPSQWAYDFKSVIGNVDMTRASIWDIRDMRCGAQLNARMFSVSKVHVASNKDLPPLSCWGPMMTASAPLHDQAKGQVLHLLGLYESLYVFMSLCAILIYWFDPDPSRPEWPEWPVAKKHSVAEVSQEICASDRRTPRTPCRHRGFFAPNLRWIRVARFTAPGQERRGNQRWRPSLGVFCPTTISDTKSY